MAAARRSRNYEPSLWDDDYLQSINSVYREKSYLERAEKLKEEVRIVLEKRRHPLEQIEVVEVVQRLGISYHFTDYADRIVESVYNMDDEWNKEELHATALKFRLLRQHGYFVPQEVFSSFLDEAGNFKNSFHNDIKGLLSLYEASYLSMEGESILDAARDFATDHLKQILKHLLNSSSNQILAAEIAHSLELPLHWRMLRLEARWFIGIYERRDDMMPVLLEFAKLDFNIVQAMYQDELKQMSRYEDEMKKGDVAKSIQCYMHETGCSEEDARDYVKHLLAATWKKVNKEAITNHLYSKDFIEATKNYIRIHQCMYQYGDGHGVPRESEERILLMIFEPIPMH
ncbi:hypothetical protein Pfo_026725 [Paulownia fortunei]|nr:hypothetical protein Pfo_026725 [Paulownia fortunei]